MSTDNAADREKVAFESADPAADRLAKLRALFPDCWAEGRINFDKFRAALGEAVSDGPERFTFSWAGRSDAAALLQMPSRATLVPKPKDSVNWDATRNLFVEGDNLEVLKLLYKAYAGKVKLAYIDPPYNTGGNDFIYEDDFTDPLGKYLRETQQADSSGNLLTSNPETSGRYHSAWLSMMYPRLFLARQLLRDDGMIFVSIDDYEVHHLRLLMNEVFGEENFLAQITWQKVYGGGAKAKHVVGVHEYALCYARSRPSLSHTSLPPDPKVLRLYKFKDEKHDTRGPYYTQPLATTSMDERPNLRFAIHHEGEEIWPEKQWQWSPQRVAEAQKNNELVFNKKDGKWSVRYKQYLRDEEGVERGSKPFSVLNGPYTQEGTDEVAELLGDNKAFSFPKPSSLVKHFIKYCWQDEDAIILDFFAGSGTTAQAVLELNRELGGNRRFIAVQLPEVTGNNRYPTIAEICKERIRRVIAKLKGETSDLTRTTPEDLGFKVFALGDSHFEQWAGVPDRDPAKYADTMNLFMDPIKPKADPVAVLWEVAIKEGYGLNSTIVTAKVGTNTVYTVTDPEKDPSQSFRACLDTELAPDIAKQLGLTDADLFICRDTALSDTLAANLALQCRLKTI